MSQNNSSTALRICSFISDRDVCFHNIDRVLLSKQTAYQQVCIVESQSFGKSLLLDGDFQSSTVDEQFYHEFLVHPALLACEKEPQTVLILGAGEGATSREVLRWKTVNKVVAIDIDGEVVEACRQYLPEMHQNAFEDPRVEVIIGDATAFLDRSDAIFDVIIFDLSDPIEEGPSFQLFTKEYFQKVRQAIAPGGYFAMQAGSVDFNYVSIHARLVNTVGSVFPHATSYTNYIPSFLGNWGFIIAGDRPLDKRPDPDAIDKRIRENSVENLRAFDGISWLGALQLPQYIRNAIARETKIYTLANPPQNQRF